MSTARLPGQFYICVSQFPLRIYVQHIHTTTIVLLWLDNDAMSIKKVISRWKTGGGECIPKISSLRNPRQEDNQESQVSQSCIARPYFKTAPPHQRTARCLRGWSTCWHSWWPEVQSCNSTKWEGNNRVTHFFLWTPCYVTACAKTHAH